MKISKYLYILVLVLALLFPTGCAKDFLDQKNTQNATDESLFKSPEDAVKLVSGIYDTFHNNDFLIKALWYQANFLTQDYQNWGSDAFFSTYEVPTSFSALEIFWNRSYEGITRANSAIQILEQMKNNGILTADLANQLTGEALFLRGVFYYYLATEFGGVPLELAIVTDDGRHPRNTQDEVFTAVINDMTTAAALLPWPEEQAPADVGRATKGAAYAYLGDALMWLQRYDEAVVAFDQLEGHYHLESNFMDIHDYDNQNGQEVVFAIQYIASTNMNNPANDTQWLSAFCMPEEITTMGYSYVHAKYYDSFEAGDLRRRATVIGPGEIHPDPKISISKYQHVIDQFGGINTAGTEESPWKGQDGLRSGYFSVKTWRDPYVNGRVPAAGAPNAYQYSAFDQILMRYGGILLSKSEALFKAGNTSEAWSVLNQIRARAGLGNANGDFMAAVTSEYRHELGGEYGVFFYLRRQGGGAATKFVQENYGITIPPGHELMPIPITAIGTNSTLVQNPGY